MAGHRLEARVGLGEERRRARGEEPHVGDAVAGEARIVEEAGVEGRDAHHRRRLGQAVDHLVDLEARQPDHRAARQQDDVGGDEEPVGVEDRQGVEEDVAVGEAPGRDQHLGVRDEVVVGQHRALRAPGGARRVEDRGEVVGPAVDRGERGRGIADAVGERAVALSVEGLEAGRQRREAFGAARIADEQRRARILDEVRDLVRGIGGVERQEDDAGSEGGEVEGEGLRCLLDLHRHPVAGPEADVGERARRRQRPGVERRPGHRPPGRVGQERGRACSERREKGVVERVGHRASSSFPRFRQ